MKKVILVFLPLFIVVLAAKSQTDVEILVNIYGAEKVESLQQANPQMVDYLIFKNKKAAYTQDMNGLKDISEFPDALEIQPVNSSFPVLTPQILNGEFPVLGYQFPISGDMHGYYRIGNSGVLLIVYPEVLIQMLYNRQNP